MKNLPVLVENEMRPLSSGEVLHAAIEKMSMEERLTAYCIIQFMQDKLAKRRELLNGRIKDDVKQVGKPSEKGHLRFELNGTVATVEKRQSKMPVEADLLALLERNGIDPSQVYDKVVTEQINPSKVDALVSVGKLKQEDVEACRKATFALTVDPSETINQLLVEAAKAFEAQKAAVSGEQPKELTEGDAPKKSKGKKKVG